MSSSGTGWVVVVPVKHSSVAKSRLSGLSRQTRAELARAFPLDCVAASIASSLVAAVLVVTDDSEVAVEVAALGARVAGDEPDAGLNPALVHGAAYARQVWGDVPVAVLSGDLPALRSAELTTALRTAGEHPRAFVTDAAGTGTTMLTAAPGVDLNPRFGAGSRDAHLTSGATELTGLDLPGLQRDVDTESDLRHAVQLGVGTHTQAALHRHPS